MDNQAGESSPQPDYKMDLSKALDILGLPSGASMPDVKKAYREQARLWHPDRYSDASALKKLAEKNIQDANLAYAFLKRQAPSAAGAGRKPARRQPPDNRTPVFGKLCAGSLQWLARFKRLFPGIDLRPWMDWLRPDSRHHYRPWYRYPGPAGSRPNVNEESDFDQVLRRAMGHSLPLKPLPHAGTDSSSKDHDGAGAPVGNRLESEALT